MRATPNTLDTAQAIRQAQPSRPMALIFESLCRVYYGEQEVIGRKPNVAIHGLGRAFGLEQTEVTRIAAAAKNHVERSRRAAMGGCRLLKFGVHKPTRWVLEDGSVAMI